ncbi:MAG: DUF29 domain-containing protein [Sphingomonadales bacterium]|nr:MAG: DUF29 domain-containing protein [Sphingomonadales bacterium]
MNKIDLNTLTSIDDDFALWAAEQGALIRSGRFDRVDVENVAEELESLGRGDKYQIDHRMEVLLAHLLKWQFQPEERSNSWKATLFEQRTRIVRLIDDSPSLKVRPGEMLRGSYIIGRYEAIRETKLPEIIFPETCPYTIEQILDPDFLPGGL